MRNIFNLLLILALLSPMVLFHSCSKHDQVEDPKKIDIIAKARQFHEGKTSSSLISTYNLSNQNKLQPIWEEAYEASSSNGTKLIVVPTSQFKLGAESKLDFYRFFSFKEQDGKIVSSHLIEVYAKGDYLAKNKRLITSSFEQSSISGFDGIILQYTKDYQFMSSKIYQSGKLVPGHARVLNRKSAADKSISTSGGKASATTSKNRVASTSSTMNEGGECIHWFMVQYFSDGSQQWEYMYTICPSGGTPTPPNPGETGNGGQINSSDPGEYVVSNTADSIKLSDLLDCFANITSMGATYSVTISADLPNNSNPNALVAFGAGIIPHSGHAFITMTKTAGGTSISQSFGFYPKSSYTAIFGTPVQRSMVNDGGHAFDASLTVSVTAANFGSVLTAAVTESNQLYDLKDYNCTDYAVKVFNTVMPTTDKLLIPDTMGNSTGLNYGTTPNGLFKDISTRKQNGATNATVWGSTTHAPNSTICP